MKKLFPLKSLLLSMAVATAATASIAPTMAQAEVSYNASVSNMYLWRGINISNPSPVVSGGADYSHDSGLYAGVWASSEGYFDESSETDLYFGYSPTFGDFGVTLGYTAYLYPNAAGKTKMFTSAYDSSGEGSMLSDYVLGASYKDLSLTGYFNTERDDSGNNVYATLDYSIGKIGLHGGINMNDDSGSEYTELKVSYAATDNLSFALSQAQGDGAIAIVGDKSAENPQMQVTYNFTF
jgi:uncharacterized protein (TIGR02001 family)